MDIIDLFKHNKRNIAKWLIGITGLIIILIVLDTLLPVQVGLYLIGMIIILLLLVIIRVQKESLNIPNHISNSYQQVEALMNLSQRLPKDVLSGLPPLRGYAASPDFLRVLVEEVARIQPRVVLEASSGVSTYLLNHLIKDIPGEKTHFALEHDPYYANVTRGLLPANNYTQVIDAPLKEYEIEGASWHWYSLDNLPDLNKIDMFVIDGPPFFLQSMARYPAVPLLLSKLKPGSVVVLDDAGRADEQRIIEAWASKFNMEKRYIYTEKGTAILTKK